MIEISKPPREIEEMHENAYRRRIEEYRKTKEREEKARREKQKEISDAKHFFKNQFKGCFSRI